MDPSLLAQTQRHANFLPHHSLSAGWETQSSPQQVKQTKADTIGTPPYATGIDAGKIVSPALPLGDFRLHENTESA